MTKIAHICAVSKGFVLLTCTYFTETGNVYMSRSDLKLTPTKTCTPTSDFRQLRLPLVVCDRRKYIPIDCIGSGHAVGERCYARKNSESGSQLLCSEEMLRWYNALVRSTGSSKIHEKIEHSFRSLGTPVFQTTQGPLSLSVLHFVRQRWRMMYRISLPYQGHCFIATGREPLFNTQIYEPLKQNIPITRDFFDLLV